MVSYLPGDASPRFTPYTLLWGLFMRYSGLSLASILLLAACVNVTLWVSGLYRLAIRLCPAQPLLPLVVLLSMLFVWGVGYDWTNAYHMYMFVFTAPYRGTFVFALCLHALAALAKKTPNIPLYACLSILGFVCHPVVGTFAFIGGWGLAWKSFDWKAFSLLQGVPVCALVIALIWPYFSYTEVFFSGTTKVWFQSDLYTNLLPALGPICLVAMPAIRYIYTQKDAFLIGGLSIGVLGYIIGYVAGIAIGGRYLFWCTFLLHLAFAQWLLSLPKTLPTYSLIQKTIAIVGLCIIVGGSLYFRGKELRRFLQPNTVQQAYLHTIRNAIAQSIGENAIVLAEPAHAWALPALTNCRVLTAISPSPLRIEEVLQQNEYVVRFLNDDIPMQERIQYLNTQQVTHIWTKAGERTYLQATCFRRIAVEKIGQDAFFLFEYIP